VNSEKSEAKDTSLKVKLKLIKELRALNVKVDSDLSLGPVDAEYCQENKVRFLVTIK